MIRLDRLELTLPSQAGDVQILKGLDLEIGGGETVSVVGPSGSGKSSMMMIVGGLERPTAGTVRVAGHSLGEMSEDALARFRRENVGIVFQDFHLVPTMTALENVAIPLEFAGRKDAFDRAAESLEKVGLGHRLSHYPGQLSGGEQQRTALARAFATGPKILLADEPTGNLDGETGRQVIDLLFELCQTDGSTLMLITHDPALAERCDRRVQLIDGHITDDGRAQATPSKAAARKAG
ncbi:ABC transporter ATP-binding protein [Rhodovibrio salinarum]|uniref:ABC transporter n=1 Tax=Rhodovibrio salinarum TaxID=1087 RepID=A0A934UZS2_9PROT|nr:ABC transporter ATP-binding protein [Rhodovibrio salinarum]MBK1696704.1 ABC transporter [Rhodovibrio salinarum]